MLVRLDPRSDKPIYLQIADSLADQITAGSLGTGERLPAARALGETLKVNMHTVLKAYSSLESRGLVEMRRGRGGVIVSAQADLRTAARNLVALAKRGHVGRADLARVIDEVWS